MKNRNKFGHFIKGHKHSLKTIEKIRLSHIGKPTWNKGKIGIKGHPSWNKGFSKYKSKICPVCKKSFFDNKHPNRIYCSRKCSGIKHQNRQWFKCGFCKKSFYRIKSRIPKRMRFCSYECMRQSKKTPYYQKYIPNNPRANRYGLIPEHRYVVEKIIGYLIPKGWHIHHINFDKLDNRPQNLYIFTTPSAHMSFHQNVYPIQSNLYQYQLKDSQTPGVPVVTHP